MTQPRSDVEANYLAATHDGVLHAYVRPDILRLDLAGRHSEVATIYRRELSAPGVIRFVPMTDAERDSFVRWVKS